ncbi:MAG: hypothetical protein QOI80_38 [Solirubrobacteraceae bacterium]|jgi:very-short-patch-repair endonuclease|nr:hypothetical protein [Solirubrobacteraceae bacterium]
MVIDCAPSLRFDDLRRLANDVQIKRLATADDIRRAIAAHPGRATRELQRLVPQDQRGATRSLLEDLLFELARERSIPLPEINAIVEGVEVDFSYPDRNVVIEADGYEFHHTRAQFEDDRAKRLHLEARGQRVLWVSYRQVTELRDRTGDQLEAIISGR